MSGINTSRHKIKMILLSYVVKFQSLTTLLFCLCIKKTDVVSLLLNNVTAYAL